MTYTPRLPTHPLLRAIAMRQLRDRKALFAAALADQNRINFRTPVRSTTFK